MSDTVIKVEGLSKRYRIGEYVGRVYQNRTLRDVLADIIYAPFRRSHSAFPRNQTKQTNRFIWALKDVSFEIKQGEVVGIIGRNGAGKTTLLKILCRITEPTEGWAEIKGRVRSVLEVGTGFHPELTGRENIYLSGAILGMTKKEINRKFDEIVAFSGVEKFLNTPVKRYSSGMLVRLGFAVAAHLEPEILLVDEVLAVGDAAFQKKCLGKMGKIVREGRTVLFVSHNMTAVRNLCSRTLLINFGQIVVNSQTDQAIARYLNQNLHEGAIVKQGWLEDKVEGVIKRDQPTIRFREVALVDQQGLPRKFFRSDEEIMVSVTYECLTVVNDLHVVLYIVDEENTPLLISQNADIVESLDFYRQEPGVYRSTCVLPANMFGERRFYVTVHLIYPKEEHHILNKVLSFDVEFRGYNNVQDGSGKQAWIRPRLSWSTQSLVEK